MVDHLVIFLYKLQHCGAPTTFQFINTHHTYNIQRGSAKHVTLIIICNWNTCCSKSVRYIIIITMKNVNGHHGSKHCELAQHAHLHGLHTLPTQSQPRCAKRQHSHYRIWRKKNIFKVPDISSMWPGNHKRGQRLLEKYFNKFSPLGVLPWEAILWTISRIETESISTEHFSVSRTSLVGAQG